MEHTESTSLLQKYDSDPSAEKSDSDTNIDKTSEILKVIQPKWRHLLILPACFLLMFGTNVCAMVQNEWSQNCIQLDYFPNTTTNFTNCDDHNKSDPVYQKYQTVQQHTATWQTYFMLAQNLPTLVVQVFLPSYTDTYGRKFLLVLTGFGVAIKNIGLTLTVAFTDSFNFIIAATIVSGLTGAVQSLFSAAYSVIADLTTSQRHRTFWIVTIEATVLFSIVLASYFSGFFIQDISLGYYETSLIGTVCCAVGFLLLLIVPESLHEVKRSRQKSILTNVKRMTDFYVSKEFKGQRALYIILLLAITCAAIEGINRNSIETLFFLGQPFCWNPDQIGNFIMVRVASQGIVGMVSLKILQYCMSDTSIAIMSPLSNAGSYIIEALATTTTAIYTAPFVGMFSFLVVPILRSLMSSMTPEDKQGALFAGLSSIEVASYFLANLSQNLIYSYTLSFMNGFVFLTIVIICVGNSLLMVMYKCRKPANRQSTAKCTEQRWIYCE